MTLREHTDRPTARRIAEIQRIHGVCLKLAFRAQHWECSIYRRTSACAFADYTANAAGGLAGLLDRIVLDLERTPTLVAWVRAFFGVELY